MRVNIVLDVRDRARKLAADQVHFAHVLDALVAVLHLPFGEDVSQDAAGVDESYLRYVAGVGNIVGEQHVA